MSCRWWRRWGCEGFSQRLIARRQQRLAFTCLSGSWREPPNPRVLGLLGLDPLFWIKSLIA